MILSSCGFRAVLDAPACLASFFENGPANITKSLTVAHNPDSWNNKANVLYIDQPVNTGFSYVDAANTTLAASKDIYALLPILRAVPAICEA
ncbi:serine carboxypeptidase domain-containing protein [Cordyceps javanica]|uniref:carboxypeptidase C n=1 Tax=Cordyceps javanica TaxID=43265 RepID=A0A545UWI3_9HYPO|nr:serine carboxypeptidase domain-containing protein [Cordyceps javanica]